MECDHDYFKLMQSWGEECNVCLFSGIVNHYAECERCGHDEDNFQPVTPNNFHLYEPK